MIETTHSLLIAIFSSIITVSVLAYLVRRHLDRILAEAAEARAKLP